MIHSNKNVGDGMKLESLEIKNKTLTQNIINSVSKYLDDLKKELPNPDYSTIIDVRVRLSEGKVYVMYEDKTDEAKRIKDIIQNALELKSKIDATTDPVEKAELIYELGNLSKEYKELTGMDLSMVI